ncbi:MAG: altronate dehydratase [Peptostreptococcaceae bacterium]|nr:altronate dehydratase [Peptostreptococcaceae bacterium]
MACIKLYQNDNVALATKNLNKGELINIDSEEIKLLNDIPNAHKIALKNFAVGDTVIKYDNSIGYVTKPILKGEWVHEHNLATGLDKEKTYSYNYEADKMVLPGVSNEKWNGYLRKKGNAGTRNYLGIITTVFCANGPAERLGELAKAKYPTNKDFDGILTLTQPYGCSQTGNDLEITAKTIAGIINNSNFGGVLVVCNGCEMVNKDLIKKYLGDIDEKRIKLLTLQDVENEFEIGMQLIDHIMEEVKTDKREPLGFDKLHIAMNCGGSDGYSGITANTLLGTLCETLVKKGATMNMTEVPEMFGAEHLLMNQAINKDVYKDIVKMIEDYKAYFEKYGEKASDNPTQGNKAGGLTTLEEKSLGCTQKGGHCAVTEVLQYGEVSTKNGFILVSGPGNDLAGVTGQIAAGASLTIFTTGRGTPAGFAGPLFRISSNTKLAKRKPHWIDYDAGRLLEAKTKEDLELLNSELLNSILNTINGNYITCNEKNGYYQMAPLKDGVTL